MSGMSFEHLKNINLRPSHQLFRFGFGILLLIVIINYLPWTMRLAGRVVDFPDLRHRVVIGRASDQDFDTAQIEIANVGVGSSRNVFIHIKATNSYITSHTIESQEPYDISRSDTSIGLLDITLERLSPGARVLINLYGDIPRDTVMASATSDQGSSAEIEPGIKSQGIQSQVETVAKWTTSLFSDAYTSISSQQRFTKLVRDIEDTSQYKSIAPSLQDRSFKKVVISVLIVILIGILFFSGRFFWIIPALVSFVVWVYFGGLAAVIAFIVVMLFTVDYSFLDTVTISSPNNSLDSKTLKKIEQDINDIKKEVQLMHLRKSMDDAKLHTIQENQNAQDLSIRDLRNENTGLYRRMTHLYDRLSRKTTNDKE